MSLSLSDLENQRFIEKEAFRRKGATLTVSDILVEFGYDLYEAEKSLKIFSERFQNDVSVLSKNPLILKIYPTFDGNKGGRGH